MDYLDAIQHANKARQERMLFERLPHLYEDRPAWQADWSIERIIEWKTRRIERLGKMAICRLRKGAVL